MSDYQKHAAGVFIVSANPAGSPLISVPFGKVSGGRAIGTQFMVSHFDELSLFQIIHTVESLV